MDWKSIVSTACWHSSHIWTYIPVYGEKKRLRCKFFVTFIWTADCFEGAFLLFTRKLFWQWWDLNLCLQMDLRALQQLWPTCVEIQYTVAKHIATVLAFHISQTTLLWTCTKHSSCRCKTDCNKARPCCKVEAKQHTCNEGVPTGTEHNELAVHDLKLCEINLSLGFQHRLWK